MSSNRRSIGRCRARILSSAAVPSASITANPVLRSILDTALLSGSSSSTSSTTAAAEGGGTATGSDMVADVDFHSSWALGKQIPMVCALVRLALEPTAPPRLRTIPSTIANPRPRLPDLVLKNGSNTLACNCRGTPRPVSEISSCTASPPVDWSLPAKHVAALTRRVATRMIPSRSPIESEAFETRLVTSCEICPELARIGGRSPAKSICTLARFETEPLSSPKGRRKINYAEVVGCLA